MTAPFIPRLLLFQCQYALYSEADQRWVDSRLPENIRRIKLPCTCRLSPHLVLNALQGGIDGILICGCMPEKCHFQEGNLGARRQLDEFVRFLVYLGMETERVRFVWIDLPEQGRIQQELLALETAVRALGPARYLASRPCARKASPPEGVSL